MFLQVSTIVLCVLSIISAIFLIYAVCTRSPKGMNSMKPILIKMAIMNALLSIFWDLGCQFRQYFPLPFLLITGFFRFFGSIGKYVTICLGGTIVFSTIFSIVESCTARLLIAFNFSNELDSTVGKCGLFFYIFIHSAVAFGFLIGYYILSDDPESIRKFAQERNLSHVIKDLNLSKEVFIFLNSDAIWFKLLDIALISIICFVIIYVSGVSYLTHWKFHRKLIISPEKLKQQRNITAMLVLQGTLPLVLLVFPIIAFVSIFLADPYYQMMYASFAFDVLYFTLSLFPLLNICVAVTMIRAYRLLFFEIVKLRRLHERGSFVVTNLG